MSGRLHEARQTLARQRLALFGEQRARGDGCWGWWRRWRWKEGGEGGVSKLAVKFRAGSKVKKMSSKCGVAEHFSDTTSDAAAHPDISPRVSPRERRCAGPARQDQRSGIVLNIYLSSASKQHQKKEGPPSFIPFACSTFFLETG